MTADHAGQTGGATAGKRDRLIAAIDELHELAWGRGEMGHGSSRRAAHALSSALGWTGDDTTTPDGPWIREQLEEALR